MSIHVALNHLTRYRYDRRVALGPQEVRLRPAPHCRTSILSYSQRITPAVHFLNWQQDPHGNYVARLTFPEPMEEFRIEVDVVAEMAVHNPFDFFLESTAEYIPFRYANEQVEQLRPFLRTDARSPLFEKYLAGTSLERTRTVDWLVALNRRVHRDVSYVVRLDPGVQSPEDTLRLGSGSCRDSAWLLVQLLRHHGLAARFVSGYLIQLAVDIPPVDGPAGPERDFTDLHAWAEIYLPGAGWIGLDPTSGLLAGEGHLPLACTPEPASAAPVTGEVGLCSVDFVHEMTVTRIHESARVTKPYTNAQWQTILDLGRTVDADLLQQDVRLTMGGEPTFVSATDRDAEEWNTSALGETKRVAATKLLHRLKDRLAPGAFLHVGQGKWYPGEQLPRWALTCYWRRDAEPVWHDQNLVADQQHPDGAGPVEARRFLHALATRLGLADDHIQAAYEDTLYYLWRDGRLPANVGPLDAHLDDELERERLRRVFTRGLDAVVGYALPVRRRNDGTPGWHSGRWVFRRERMYLTPGDSPMGYRLPLDSLPWLAEDDVPRIYPRDPFAFRATLPARTTWLRPAPALQRATRRHQEEGRAAPDAVVLPRRQGPVAGSADDPNIRTAICAEARDGVLFVFMPPVEALEDYLELVTATEATAMAVRVRVILEGYPPPDDPRLRSFRITPDPGVLEVNVEPASSWDQLVHATTVLYEEARQAGLVTEKFMIDGRHTGTGGGNHVVLGGPTAADSPFLRRPDLLRSLLTYWHNHPSLSYLFSGLFLGPTSQSPRVDEARHDTVYELEIAFDTLPGPGAEPRPWMVDRALRHLLTDVTGNTHRAEFCIDKLYSPDSSSGRKGLLEMRAFEMPPHERMSLVQQLLLRTLVAAFWREPCEARLARWGTALHDRFALPYYLWHDFTDVIDDLRRRGYPLELDWFTPHLEFRFPVAGEWVSRAVRLTLRQALEPWHVLGEEATSGGTARYVDSSVERLQVHVEGLTSSDRYVIACNGRAIPLQPTGRNGEFVAGVRFRAWQPPSCLHPTIPVHSPLTFDLVDTWLHRSMGGCQYHVVHPGGRNYDTLPVNGHEAESRRLSRFFRFGHTPGTFTVQRPARSHEFPCTLDLRTSPAWPPPSSGGPAATSLATDATPTS